MYNPRLFQERDPARLFDLVDAHPFGTLIVAGADVAHVPFLLDRGVGASGRLRCHVARANSIWRGAAAGRPLLAVFQGPDAYVSASWYEKPREQVPTWNYAVVHAHGTATEMSRDELRALLVDLSARFETGDAPWRLDALAPAFVDELLDEIVGLSIDVARLEGKFKLSQNRSDADRARVIDALRRRAAPDDVEMLRLMA